MEEVKLGKLELLRKKTISYLRNYGRNSNDYKGWVVLCAPAHGADNLLRVYMNGGNIGKIAISDKARTTGISSSEYANKYKGEIPDIVAILKEDSKCSEEQRLEALIDTNYLNYAKEATKKYSNKANHKDTERTTETLIMDYHNQESGNAAIDMELQYSIKHFGWTKTKRPGQNYKPSRRICLKAGEGTKWLIYRYIATIAAANGTFTSAILRTSAPDNARIVSRKSTARAGIKKYYRLFVW